MGHIVTSPFILGVSTKWRWVVID